MPNINQMNPSVEISDDDDSLNDPSTSPWNLEADDNTVLISSDDDMKEVNTFTDECLLSEEDSPILEHKSNITKSTNEHKENIIRNLFPNVNIPENNNLHSNEIPKASGHVQMIGGVEVNMPVKPYGCQIALIYKVSNINWSYK